VAATPLGAPQRYAERVTRAAAAARVATIRRVTDAAMPGWYPDPWGESPQRFWDGTAWTPYVGHPGPASGRPPLPDGARTSSATIWAIALLPVVGLFGMLLVRIDTASIIDYMRQVDELTRSGQDPSVVPYDPFTIFGPGALVAEVLSLLAVAAVVVLAYRDRRQLTQLGLVRPFHWAWAFLGGIVYVIGRTVVVRKAAPLASRAPMWTAITVEVVRYVAILAWTGVMMAAMIGEMASLGSP